MPWTNPMRFIGSKNGEAQTDRRWCDGERCDGSVAAKIDDHDCRRPYGRHGLARSRRRADGHRPMGQVDEKTGKPESWFKITERNGIYEGAFVKIFFKPGEDPNWVCDKCQGADQGRPVQTLTLIRGMQRNGLSRSEEHTSELQSLRHLVCRLLL